MAGKKNILFICTGNTCRSPMAEGYFRYLCKKNKIKGIGIKSAGVCAVDGAEASHGVIQILKSLGVDLSGHRSQNINSYLLDWADTVIVMTKMHKNIINKRFPSFRKEIGLLKHYDHKEGDVLDPIGGDFCAYKLCFSDMQQALDNLFITVNRVNAN